MRRSGLATTSGSAGTGPGNDTGVWLIITIILFALLCNYSRTICLIDVGTEGDSPRVPGPRHRFRRALAPPHADFLLRLLPSVAHPSVARQGHPAVTKNTVAR